VSVHEGVSYAYLVRSVRFASTLEFSKFEWDGFEVSDKNVTKTKFQLEVLHAEEDALMEMDLPVHRIVNSERVANIALIE